MTVNGQNFVSSATVQWNGSRRTPTFVSSSQLQVQISAGDIANAGSSTVSVTNPSPGGGNSGLAMFQVDSTSNPTPSLTGLSPLSIGAGSPAFLLTINGDNFLSDSAVHWNGSAVPTTYLSATQLEAQIPASNLVTAGVAEVTVVNSAPAGGESAPLVFSINSVPLVIKQASNDLAWDSTHQLIFLSVPSIVAGTGAPVFNGNVIMALDPFTGSIRSSQFASSEPDILSISDDNHYLYAGSDGSSSVQRFTLPDLTPDMKYSLGADLFWGPTYAVDLHVAPGAAHTTAVSRGVSNVSPYADAGMAIYDDNLMRPTIANASGDLYDSFDWGSATTLYAINSEISNFNFYVLNASAGGVVQTGNYTNKFSTFYASMHYDRGNHLVYTDDGYVINPVNAQWLGRYRAGGWMIPDSTLNQVFFLGQTAAQAGTNDLTIVTFNLTTFDVIGEIVVPSVQGIPRHLIRWGANGLAFDDDAGFLYILNGPFAATTTAQAAAVQREFVPITKTSLGTSLDRKLIRTSVSASPLSPWHSMSRPKLLAHDSGVPNPAPQLTALSPSKVMVGLNGFTLTVTGSNFVSLSTVNWNGSPRPTEFLSSTQLQAQISPSDVALVGTATISVATPAPGGGTSSALPLSIIETSNKSPRIVSLFPDGVLAGSGGFTLDINGAWFNSSSMVEWNGTPHPSSLNGQGQLEIQVEASDVATPGFVEIRVINPPPGGGSVSAQFQIFYQPTSVNQVSNDMVWDSRNQLLYISVPSTSPAHSNQVCSLNPATVSIVNCQSAGSEPNVLALSDDGQFLYVGEDGTGSVQRFKLPGLTPDISISLGSDPFDGPFYARSMEVAPGVPHTIAVSRGIKNLIPKEIGGIAIYDDSTQRPTIAPGWGGAGNAYSSLTWGADASALYASDAESTMSFFTLTVNSSGVVLDHTYPNVFWNPGKIHYDHGSGLVYSDDGFHVIDPSTGLPTGLIEVGGGWPMVPDSDLNTVFVLSQYIFQGNSNYTLYLFDANHYVPITRIPFTITPNSLNGLGNFVRWGTNGLAVNDPTGKIYLLSGSFVDGH